MATTNSTNATNYASGQRYKPKLVKVANSVAMTSGASALGAITPTFPYTQARLTLHAKAIGAATTVTCEVLTGPTSVAAAITQMCLSASGSTGVSVATTAVTRRVFRGLNRWTRVAYYCAGTNASSDVSIDMELL